MSKTVNAGMLMESVDGIRINADYPCNVSNYAKMSSRSVSYVVMHYTGNTKDTAVNNVKYYQSYSNLNASAHLFVDDTSIYQSVPLHDIAWHCGTSGTYYHNSCRNANSIGIEMCCTAGNYKISEATKEHGAQLCAYLCKLLGISSSGVDTYVLRHYDVTHKLCPAQMAGVDNAEWTKFKDRVKAILDTAATTTSITITPMSATGTVTATNLNVRNGPSTEYGIISGLSKGSTVTITGSYNGWYKIQSGSADNAWVSAQYITIHTQTTEQEDDIMTGEQIYNALREYLATHTLGDSQQAELQEAVNMGITDGSEPTQLIQRYQAAIMVKRAVENSAK